MNDPESTLCDAFLNAQLGRNNHAIEVEMKDGSRYQPPMLKEEQFWYDMGVNNGLLMGVALAFHHPGFMKRLADSMDDDWKSTWKEMTERMVEGWV